MAPHPASPPRRLLLLLLLLAAAAARSSALPPDPLFRPFLPPPTASRSHDKGPAAAGNGSLQWHACIAELQQEYLGKVKAAVGNRRALLLDTSPADGWSFGDSLTQELLLAHLPAGSTRVGCSLKSCDVEAVKKLLDVDTVILLPEDHHFGDVWRSHSTFRNMLLSNFAEHQILMLPQGIHYRQKEQANEDAVHFAKHAHHLRLFVRDQVSLNASKELFPEIRSEICPSAAFMVGPIQRTKCSANHDRETDILILTTLSRVGRSRVGDNLKKVIFSLEVEGVAFQVSDWPNMPLPIGSKPLLELLKVHPNLLLGVPSQPYLVNTQCGRDLVVMDGRQGALAAFWATHFATRPACSRGHLAIRRASTWAAAVHLAKSLVTSRDTGYPVSASALLEQEEQEGADDPPAETDLNSPDTSRYQVAGHGVLLGHFDQDELRRTVLNLREGVRDPRKSPLACPGGECPEFRRCHSEFAGVSACKISSLADEYEPMKAPLNCPPLRRHATQEGDNMELLVHDPTCTHIQDFKRHERFNYQVFVLHNVYFNSRGQAFNSTHYFDRNDCSSARRFAYEAGTNVTYFKDIVNFAQWNGGSSSFLLMGGLLEKLKGIPIAHRQGQSIFHHLVGEAMLGLPLSEPSVFNIKDMTDKELFFAERLIMPLFMHCGRPARSVMRYLRTHFYLTQNGLPIFNPDYSLRKHSVAPHNPENWVIVLGKRYHTRGLVQSDEVQALMESLWGKERVVIFDGSLPILEAKALLNRARLFVAVHGAHMANMLLMPVNATIVEIRPILYSNPCFHHLAEVCQLQYYLLMAEGSKDTWADVNIGKGKGCCRVMLLTKHFRTMICPNGSARNSLGCTSCRKISGAKNSTDVQAARVGSFKM
eukprot:SM000267S09859  [mRNA]  locus=s267:27420:32431:- [translate_table: standard]